MDVQLCIKVLNQWLSVAMIVISEPDTCIKLEDDNDVNNDNKDNDVTNGDMDIPDEQEES